MGRQVTDWYVSDKPLIPLLTEGGQPSRPAEEQFNWKKEAVRKSVEWEEIKRREKLTIAAFSTRLVSVGRQQWALIQRVN